MEEQLKQELLDALKKYIKYIQINYDYLTDHELMLNTRRLMEDKIEDFIYDED